MTYQLPYAHGDLVLVLGRDGQIEARGTIVGRCRTRTGPHYDVQPSGTRLDKRICGIPEGRVMRLGKPYLAYERQADREPRHVLDEA